MTMAGKDAQLGRTKRMIQFDITVHTDRDELKMIPLSEAEQEAIWSAFKELASHATELHGDCYTLSLSFIGRKFHSVEVWRMYDLTDPVEVNGLALAAWPEDILNKERWTNDILPSMFDPTFFEKRRYYLA